MVAESPPGPGPTLLRVVRSDGPALAVRRTSPAGTGAGGDGGAAHVHLVGTAAGPMGGDEVRVRLVVGPGARLVVAGVAATVVLPSRTEPRSRLLLEVDVAAAGLLVCTLPPVVVTGRAALAASTRVRLVGDGQVRLVEQVRLGRHGEAGGWWQGRLEVTRDEAPLLRQTTTLGAVPDDGVRGLRSVLDSAGTEERTDDRTVRLALAPGGGTLTVTVG